MIAGQHEKELIRNPGLASRLKGIPDSGTPNRSAGQWIHKDNPPVLDVMCQSRCLAAFQNRIGAVYQVGCSGTGRMALRFFNGQLIPQALQIRLAVVGRQAANGAESAIADHNDAAVRIAGDAMIPECLINRLFAERMAILRAEGLADTAQESDLGDGNIVWGYT